MAIKLVMVEAKVAKVTTGIEFLVTNPKSTIQIGVTIWLPPIPAIVEMALKNIRAKKPPISIECTGNAGLCSHFLLTHTSAQFSREQSVSTVHFFEATE